MTDLWVLLLLLLGSVIGDLECECSDSLGYVDIVSQTPSRLPCGLCKDEFDGPHPKPHHSTTHSSISTTTGPTFGPDQLKCLDEEQTIQNQSILWPSINQGTSTPSHPLCLDENLMIIKRTCKGEGQWEDAPNCATIQNPVNACPPDLTNFEAQYCYTILEKSTFPPKCPYPKTVAWDDYVPLNLFPDEPVWMPVLRLGIDVYRYVETTQKYLNPFQLCTQRCHVFSYNDTFLDKPCQVYHNATHVEAVRCDASYHALCVYEALHLQKSSWCEATYPNCKQSGYSTEAPCFCKALDGDVAEHALAELLVPHQNLLFTTNSYRIGLQKIDNNSLPNPFLWTTTSTTLNYTNWAEDVNFDRRLGILSEKGWILGDTNSTNCSIYKLQVHVSSVDMDLSIEATNFKLTIVNSTRLLSSNNKDPLVYCFTNAEAKSIIHRIPDLHGEMIQKDIYVIKFGFETGPGSYWCHAFSYPDLSLVTTPPKMIEDFVAEYVVLLKVNNYQKELSSYPLTLENLEVLQNSLKNELPSSLSFFPRLFKITDLDERNKSINITFHLTSSNAQDTMEEYNELKKICIAQKKFEFLDFRAVRYCASDNKTLRGPIITWPQTARNEEASPLFGHCVTSKVTLIRRRCSGDFIDGAYWEDIHEICEFYRSSHLTEKLIEISNKLDKVEEALGELLEVSKDYGSFHTLDFVLVAKFIKDISLKKPNLEILTEIVSNLMEIPRPVLLSAQLNFRSSDTLLQAIDTVLEEGDLGEWTQANFAVRSIDIRSDSVQGYQLQRCINFNKCLITPIFNSSLLYNETYILTEEVYAAVSLSPKLFNQISQLDKPKLIVTIFYGSQLFVELENPKYSSLVFGVLLPNFTGDFDGPVSTYYYNNLQRLYIQYNCSYWKFDGSSSGVWAMEGSEEVGDAIACDYYHVTNFGIQFSHKTSTVCIPNDEIDRKCFTDKGECIGIKLGTVLDQFCLSEDLRLIPTGCFSNFTDKAYLEDMFENCRLYMLPKRLRDIFTQIGTTRNDSFDSPLNIILSLTEDPENMTEVEVLVVASLMQLISESPMDMAKLTIIVNNMMTVPTSVIHNAQEAYQVVDIMVSSIETALANGKCGEWKTEKFAIKCISLSESRGVLIQGNITANLTFGEFLEVSNSTPIKPSDGSTSIVLSDNLLDQIQSFSQQNPKYTPKLVVSIYQNSDFFVDLSTNQKESTLVFGVLLPGFDQQFRGPLQIYSSRNASLAKYSCSFWKSNENTFGTWATDSVIFGNDSVVCEFSHLTNFVISRNALNNSSDTTICHLESIADRVDMCIDECDDLMLYTIDEALGNFEGTSLVSRANVLFLTVSKEDVQHFEGFFVTTDKEVFCIFTELELFSLEEYEIDVSVTLSKELLAQIAQSESPIMFTILYNEVLFPAEQKIRAPIVEVLIPGVHQQLKGDISIRYKNEHKGRCSYWDFGSWKGESPAEFNGQATSCTFNHVTHFALVSGFHNITSDLEEILASNLTGLEKLKQVEKITYSNHNSLIPVDVYLISQIITTSLLEGALPKIVTRIISSLFLVPRSVLKESQQLHSATDIILYAVDELASMLSDQSISLSNFSLIVQSLQNYTDFTGVVLSDCEEFQCDISLLSGPINIDDYVHNKSMSAMVMFGEELVEQIRQFADSPKISITIYYSDVLFNEVGNQRNTSKIFGVTFPGLKDELNGTVSVIFNVGTSREDNQCAYWHYKADPTGNLTNATLGQWRNETDKARKDSLAICTYDHVTHFGMLLANSDELDNDSVLDLMTDIGAALSLFGILVILLTALLFKKWRQNTGNKILINFSFSISIKIVTLYVSAYIRHRSSSIHCAVTGAILHYAILSECAWMLTVAILQFKRFVEVLGGPPKYVLVKALICGWIFPIFPVVCVLAIDPYNYEEGIANVCYPSNLGLYLGVWLPVLLILTINCIIFTFIIYNVFHKKTECIHSTNYEMLFQWRLALLLFFMLGLNWAFGFLGQIRGDVLFTYLYSVSASLQGFVLFLFFILFNKSTRFLYSQAVKQWFYTRGIFKVWQPKPKVGPRH